MSQETRAANSGAAGARAALSPGVDARSRALRPSPAPPRQRLPAKPVQAESPFNRISLCGWSSAAIERCSKSRERAPSVRPLRGSAALHAVGQALGPGSAVRPLASEPTVLRACNAIKRINGLAVSSPVARAMSAKLGAESLLRLSCAAAARSSRLISLIT